MEMPVQPTPQAQPQVLNQPQPAYVQPPPKSRRGCVTCLIVTLIILLLLMCCCSCSGFAMLSLIGAKGQPGTIIKPSSPSGGATTATPVGTPTGLTAAASDAAIDLKWNSVSNAKEVRVYRSEKPGKDFQKLDAVASGISAFTDQTAKKGTTYYYVITALDSGGSESGNSAQVSAAIDVPPLVPKGIYSWQDVKTKAAADKDYLRILTEVTGLTMTDVDRLVVAEKTQNLKTTLYAGTIIVNTMEDFRIVPNFTLTYTREALTDENGKPHVLTRCGNPMRLQVPVSQTAVFVETVQVFVTTIINVFPTNITNIFINAGQSANGVIVRVLPNGVLVNLGPNYAPPEPTVFIDPATFGDDLYNPETDIKLEPGQQWIQEGKLLITATPPDPAPQETVTMTVKIFPTEAGVEADYSMAGTDGYTTSGKGTTDANGEFSFTIPGGAADVHDTVTVSIPSKSINGTVEYTF